MAFGKEKEEQRKQVQKSEYGDERWEWLERGWRRRKSWRLRHEGWEDWRGYGVRDSEGTRADSGGRSVCEGGREGRP